MSEHTREPWEHVETRVYLGNEGGFDLRGSPAPEANARRIVACVNACDSVSNDQLDNICVADLIDVGKRLAKMTEIARNNAMLVTHLMQQRDKLLAALKQLEALTFCEDNVLRASGLGEAGAAARTLITEIEGA